jgi:hypothetical protein
MNATKKYNILQIGRLKVLAIAVSAVSSNPQRNCASYLTGNLSEGYTPDQYLNSLMLGRCSRLQRFSRYKVQVLQIISL